MEAIHFPNIKVLRSKPVCEYATASLINSPIHCKVLLIQELQTISCQLRIKVPTIPLYDAGYGWDVPMVPICVLLPQTHWLYPNYQNRPGHATNSPTYAYHSSQYPNYVRQAVQWISNMTRLPSTTSKGSRWLRADVTRTAIYT